MSEKKNGFEFDKELLSSLENLKRKYSSFDDLEMDIQMNTPKEEPVPVEYEIKASENEPPVQQSVSGYEIDKKQINEEDQADTEYDFYDSLKNKYDPDIENDTNDDIPEANEVEPETNDIYSYSSAEELQDDNIYLSEDEYKHYNIYTADEEDDEFADLDDEEEDSIKLFSGKKRQKTEKPQKVKKKSRFSKKTLTIILVIAAPILIWVTMFVTDLILVNQWYSPFFCIETAQYENGGRDYLGLFYKVQFKVDSNGEAYGEIIPWGVKGPND